MSTPREQAIEMAITAIEIHLSEQADWLEESHRGERVIIHMKKVINSYAAR